jgi:hypothetical protein
MPSLEGGDDLGSYECGLTIPSMVIYKCYISRKKGRRRKERA